MRYVIQLVCWLLRFMDKSTEWMPIRHSLLFLSLWDLFPL